MSENKVINYIIFSFGGPHDLLNQKKTWSYLPHTWKSILNHLTGEYLRNNDSMDIILSRRKIELKIVELKIVLSSELLS